MRPRSVIPVRRERQLKKLGGGRNSGGRNSGERHSNKRKIRDDERLRRERRNRGAGKKRHARDFAHLRTYNVLLALNLSV